MSQTQQQQPKNVTLYLKIPSKPISLLQRLEASQLESLIEYKLIEPGTDLRRVRIFDCQSVTQIKGNVEVIDGELMVRFPARHIGIHTARVFANTKEICRPVAFIVKSSGEVESIDITTGVMESYHHQYHDSGLASGTSTVRGVESHPPVSFYLPSSPPSSPTGGPPISFASGQAMSHTTGGQHVSFMASGQPMSPTGMQPLSPTGVMGQPPLSPTIHPPLSPTVHQQQSTTVTGQMSSSAQQQHLHMSQFKQTSRPVSGNYEYTHVSSAGTSEYPGDLFGRPSGASFEQLLTAKMTKQVVPGIPHSSSSRPTSTTEYMTQETITRISREAKHTTFGKQMKKRCNICSRKIKASKSVSFWEMDFCDSCCKRNYMQRSAIEHFTPPSIQECAVQVPMNKRGTKITTVRRIMPNVNLRGLDPSDVRNAMTEFHKFDVEGDGWMDSAVLVPVLKACFTYSMPRHEIKSLLSSASLASMTETMGLHKRAKVHHIEYLSLLAFIARERQRITRDLVPNSKFTHNDLEMAYAFQNQFPKSPQHGGHTHPHKTAASANEKPRLLTVGNPTLLPKSVTIDSPLSHYQPTSLAVEKIPPSFKQPLPTSPSITQSPSVTLSTTDHNEKQEEEERDEAPPTSSAPQTENDKKMKKSAEQPMEQLKLTGDGRADGWMLY